MVEFQVVAVGLQSYFRFYYIICRRMQRLSNRGPSGRDLRTTKLTTVTSKNKKQHKQSSQKNIKLLKSISPKGKLQQQESKIKLKTSPQGTDIKQMDNDYGVNPYYPRYKVKTSQKKDQEVAESTDYGTLSHSKEAISMNQLENRSGSKLLLHQESDYTQTAFQKIKLPNPRGLINAQGKFVSARPQRQLKNHSFHHKSTSKHSFSLNLTSRQQSRYKKKKNKSKSKPKLLEAEHSREYKTKTKSLEKTFARDHHQSYYERSFHKSKNKGTKKINKHKQMNQCQKIASINSKANSIGADPREVYLPLALTQDPAFIDSVKFQILQDSQTSHCEPNHNKLTASVLRERGRALQMISRICGLMSMKKETYFLCMHYLDTFICTFSYPSLKLVSLGALTLALKIDDAEMVSKFCYNYLCNPERTVKKSGSTKYLKIKQKQSMVKDDGKQLRSKLSTVIATRVSQGKGRQDYSLQQILDFQTHMMVKLGFKLTVKTVSYWLDLFTALWDSYLAESPHKHWDILAFRDENRPKNLNLALHLIQNETLSMGHYGKGKVGLVLGAVYLVGRLSLEESQGRQNKEELWRKYKSNLMKSSNLVFCDGVGANQLFGDFLGLFDLSLMQLVDSVQVLSRHLDSEVVLSESRVEGLSRQDRLSTHFHSDGPHWDLSLH